MTKKEAGGGFRRADFFDRFEFPPTFLEYLGAELDDFLEIKPVKAGWLIRKHPTRPRG